MLSPNADHRLERIMNRQKSASQNARKRASPPAFLQNRLLDPNRFYPSFNAN
jgi:hypothetical protein